MQIYFMHKDGISIGSSSFTLLINVTCMLFATVTMGFINLTFNYQYMDSWLMAFYIFGQFINTCAIILFAIAMFSEKTLDKIISFGKKIIKKVNNFRIEKLKKAKLINFEHKIKKIEENGLKLKEKLDSSATKYKENANIIKQNKNVVLKTLMVYFFQYGLYFSTAYWAYRAVGLIKHNIFDITTLQSVVFATTSGIPSPGAVGISEAVYIGLFKNLIPEELLNSIMLLTRVMNFYLFVIISGIVVLCVIMHGKSAINQEKM